MRVTGTDVGLAAGFVLMWSSGFVGATMGTEITGSTTLLFWRFLVVTGLLALWWLLVRRTRITVRDLGVHAVLGLLSQAGYLSGVVFAAELGVPAGTSALIAALQPLVAAALSGPLLGQHTTPRQWLGLAIGLGGVALVVSGDLGGGATPLAYALPLLAMLSLVAGTFAERKLPSTLPLGESLLIQSATSTVCFAGIAAATGSTALPTAAGFWPVIAWLVVLSTFGGYGFYWLNVRRGSVTRVSTLLYLTPPTTMVAALVMFGEPVTVTGLAGLLVCFAAVPLALRPPRTAAAQTAPQAPSQTTTEAPAGDATASAGTGSRAMMSACSSTTSSTPRPSWPRRGRATPRPRRSRGSSETHPPTNSPPPSRS
ncbi:DMT family transporter [Prauserella rugosa]|uniref:DMT family transporter n=1 Tax=Prauserella rugosa TaxID=43354 RepID=UPI001FE7F40C|nr:DMT family transporter [Prauserella rugosa]